MKKLYQIFFAALIFIGCSTNFSVADAYDGSLEDVVVTGSVTKEVAPDMATINFTATGEGRDAKSAAAASAEKFAKIKGALLGANIISDDLEQVSYSLYPVYDDKGKISGYRANSIVKVNIDDLDKIGNVIDRISASGVSRIDSLHFSVKNKELLQRQLLAEAVKNARQQAEVLAAAGNRQVGRMLTVSSTSYSNMGRMYSQADFSYKAANAETKINAGNIKVRANVEAVFALE